MHIKTLRNGSERIVTNVNCCFRMSVEVSARKLNQILSIWLFTRALDTNSDLDIIRLFFDNFHLNFRSKAISRLKYGFNNLVEFSRADVNAFSKTTIDICNDAFWSVTTRFDAHLNVTRKHLSKYPTSIVEAIFSVIMPFFHYLRVQCQTYSELEVAKRCWHNCVWIRVEFVTFDSSYKLMII